MALDPTGLTVVQYSDADIAERTAFGQVKFERMAQNFIALTNLINQTRNPWALGSDAWDHFADALTTTGGRGQFTRTVAGQTHSPQDHLYSLTSAGEIRSTSNRRIDRVPSIFETRVKFSAFSTSLPFIGLFDATSAPDANTDNYAGFRKGTNTNTYKVVTRSSDTDRTTTDNLAANYTGWDTLRIEARTGAYTFYINGTLVATHTTSLPNSAIMYAFISGASSATLDVDYAVLTAISNSLSP